MSQFLSRRLDQLVPYTPGEQPQDQQYVKLNTNESPYPPSSGVIAALNAKEAADLRLYSDPEAKVLKAALAERYGVENTNESPYPPSSGVIAALNAKEAADLRLYSDPEAKVLKAALAERYGVESANIFVGNGSDEVLNFAFLAYAADGRGVAFADITYGFYPVFADLYRIPVQIVPLREDFTLEPEDYYGLHRTIVIANPNAPTGLALSRAQVEGILQANPDCVVVLDEAYVDFGGESCVSLTGRYPNLLVVQTYSKSRSMAGARLGYAIGDSALIRDLETIKFSINPYNINRLTLKAGAQALAEQAYYDKNCQRIMETRAYTAQELEKLGFTVLPSQANFLFVRKLGTEGADIYRCLKERGVLVRPNLLVVQTYSKSRSMAGARLGYAIGDSALIRDLETIKFSINPYNINRLTLKAGAQALAEQAYYDKNCQRIMETRAYTAQELEKLGFTVLPSQANFLFVRKLGTEGADIYRCLKERGVLVRHFDKERIRDYNRITIGTREQMDILLEKLREFL